MSLENQIQKLEDQKKTLDQKLVDLKQKRTQEVSAFVQELDLKDIDSQTLIGLIVETLENPLPNDKKERWHRKGKKFCRQKKARLGKPIQKNTATKAA